MHVLVPEVVVAEQRLERAHVRHAAFLEGEPARTVHPGVHGDDHQRTREAGYDDRNPGEEMSTRGEAVPAVDVDGDEDRLDEEGERLEREPEAEDVTERRHETGPEKAELEAEDRPRDDADGEQGEHHFGPALRDGAVDGIAGPEPERLHEDDKGGKGHPEAHEWDVHGERERLHLPGLEQVFLVDGSERHGGEDGYRHAGAGPANPYANRG